jgi:biopolymer transport protein ExbD
MARTRKSLPEINITPLVDVLLILLVVLLMAMPMFTKKLPVNLPKTDINGAPVLTKSVSLAITAKGQYLMDGGPTSFELIEKAINKDTTVEISADASVPYDKVAKLVGVVQKKNPKDIALMVQ